MKKKKVNKKDRGLRTFFLYAFIVFFVILASLSIKAIFILRQNKFDGRNLNLAIAQNNRAVAILGFNPVTNSISLLKIKKSNISIDSVPAKLGIIPDAKLTSEADLSNESSTSILTKSALRNDGIKTDLTIFDIARLILFSKTTADKDYKVKEIDLSSRDYDNSKIINSLFKNDTIVSENVSIEIINATEKSGVGSRLERALSNMGANVVSVSTARETQNNSAIKYFGHNGYTVTKLRNLLKLPIEKLKYKSVADVTIIIGEDSQNTNYQ